MKKITEIVEKFNVISIVGNTKNAGKTTVINALIDDYFNCVIALSSIGLDGEEIDQVTFQEKPRIYAKEDYLIATAKGTLDFFEADYEVLLETDIDTSIGTVDIVKIIKPGNVLIAGPSKISDMQKVIKIFEKYNPEKTLIDGAFFRHSTAKISQATIFVIGANLSARLEKVIQNAKLSIKKFNLKEYSEKALLSNMQNICFVGKGNKILELDFDSVIGKTDIILQEKYKDYESIYLPKALTNEFAKELIKKRKDYNFNIIVNSPVNIQLEESVLNNLFKLKGNIFVMESVNLVAICYNPTSPRGYAFDDEEFKDRLQNITDIDVINVNKDV